MFEHLENLEVKADDTLRMEVSVPALSDKPLVFIGRHAGTTNKPYQQAVLKWSLTKKAKEKGKKGVVAVGGMPEITDDMVEEKDALDRELFAAHIITDWEDIPGKNGKPVKFSKEACADFFKHVPDDIFYAIRGAFSDPNNFRGMIAVEDALEKGKK